MTLTGHVFAGQIVLDGPLQLPDGTEVRVEAVVSPVTESSVKSLPPTLKERLSHFLSHAVDLPEDAASNHDKYLNVATEK